MARSRLSGSGPAKLTRQGLAVDQLGDDERRCLVHRRIVDSDDVRVIERARGARLGDEKLDPIAAHVGALAEELERHFALQAGIPGAIDFTHPAAAECRQDLVGTERAAAGAGCHGEGVDAADSILPVSPIVKRRTTRMAVDYGQEAEGWPDELLSPLRRTSVPCGGRSPGSRECAADFGRIFAAHPWHRGCHTS
jgi:hypothetical protein